MQGLVNPSLLPIVILLLVVVHGKDGGSQPNPIRLEVYNDPQSSEDADSGTLKLTEGATLNLTCKVASPEEGEGEVKLSWYLPTNFVESQKRYEQTGQDSTSTLVISPVIETDTGDYECWARQRGGQVKKKLKVLIEPRRGDCQPGQYQCDTGHCIARRYRCDHFEDCPDGDDESILLCGHDPCKGKIVCPDLDFRCIDPTEYCCDPNTDPDCSFMYTCCEAVMEFSIRNRLTAQFAKHQLEGGNQETSKGRRESDLAYLHSTVYTIIGCAVAFLIIVMSLGFAICRLHLQRKTAIRQGRGSIVRGAGRAHPPLTLHDLDIYFSSDNRGGEGEEGDFQHIGITYNINHGVQIMGRGEVAPPAPPPYSTSPRRGAGGGTRAASPPPPYRVSENVAEMPLLVAEDDNNNGDINGNSDMVDNNVTVQEGAAMRVVVQEGGHDATPPPEYPDSSDTE